jgi:FAD:protein FMN transferase
MQTNKLICAQSADFAMNTVITHKVFGANAEEALQAAKSEIGKLEGLLSRYMPDSDISRINKSAGRGTVKLSPQTYEVLADAFKFAELGQGCFDMTIGPLVDLWRNSKNLSRAPGKSSIAEKLELVCYHDLILDPAEQTASLRRTGQSIDLGGIGKGYAADQILKVFLNYGIESAYTNFGGNVAVIGAKPDQSAWRIGIQHPRLENKLIGIVSAVNKAVVTSGDYQRFFMDQNGKRHHHILDPKTGYPSESGLSSVTVVAENSLVADALSTILFITGIWDGLELLKLFLGVEAVFIDINLIVHVTQGLKDYFQAGENIKMRTLS